MNFHTAIPVSIFAGSSRLNGQPAKYVLPYYRHSVVHNGLRKLPVYTAVNIDGRKEVKYSRKDGGGDTWYRDNRIPLEDQLTNAWYRNSGFDRGHMVRREDAEWGRTVDEGKRGSDDTFRFTNCCPQIGTLNQSKQKGNWGLLEVFILERGARNAEYHGKISVFNGPVFTKDDPVFRSVPVPMKYWKIVAWKSESGDLKATGFLLSQSDLVSAIEFEDFAFDSEFKTYQMKISEIGKMAGLDFGVLAEVDTFRNVEKKEMVGVENIVM